MTSLKSIHPKRQRSEQKKTIGKKYLLELVDKIPLDRLVNTGSVECLCFMISVLLLLLLLLLLVL